MGIWHGFDEADIEQVKEVDEPMYLCCPECGNTDFIEIPATTHRGREYVLHCASDDCTWTALS